LGETLKDLTSQGQSEGISLDPKAANKFMNLEREMKKAREKGDDDLYNKLGANLGQAFIDMIVDGPG